MDDEVARCKVQGSTSRQNTWEGGIEGVSNYVAIGKPLDKVVFMQSSAIENFAGHRMHVPCRPEVSRYANHRFGCTRITLSRRIAEERSEVQLEIWGRGLGTVVFW